MDQINHKNLEDPTVEMTISLENLLNLFSLPGFMNILMVIFTNRFRIICFTQDVLEVLFVLTWPSACNIIYADKIML